MRVERKIGELGETADIIHFDNGEGELLDQAHEIVRERFEKEGVPYDCSDRERVEYWLLGILLHEGTEKVLDMARNAPFAKKHKTHSIGYAETKEVEE